IIHRMVAEQLEPVMADAEIVDGELEAGKAELAHQRGELRQRIVVEALGYLEADGGGRNAGARQMSDEALDEIGALRHEAGIEVDEERARAEIRQGREGRDGAAVDHVLQREELA